MRRALEALSASKRPLPNLTAITAVRPADWHDLLSRLRLAIEGSPAIVVLDEFPWAVESSPGLDGLLQALWDQELRNDPLLLVLVGSEQAMMQRLFEHDRPLFAKRCCGSREAFRRHMTRSSRVGAWWDRTGRHEYDAVCLDGDGAAVLVGSIKWRDRFAIAKRDVLDLARARAVIPRAEGAGLLAIGPRGARADSGADLALNAKDLLAAWDRQEAMRQVDALR